MEISNWVLLAVGLFLFALYLSNVAGRLDRLHLKVENARNALDRQLALRSAICSDIAGLDLLDAKLRNRLATAGVIAISLTVCTVSLIRHTHWFTDLLGGLFVGSALLVAVIAVDRYVPSKSQLH